MTNRKAKYYFIDLVKSGVAFFLHFTKKKETIIENDTRNM